MYPLHKVGKIVSKHSYLHSVSKETHHKFIGFPWNPESRSGDPDRVVFYHDNLKQVTKNPIQKCQTVLPISCKVQGCVMFLNLYLTAEILLAFSRLMSLVGYRFQYCVCFPGLDPDQNLALAKFRAYLPSYYWGKHASAGSTLQHQMDIETFFISKYVYYFSEYPYRTMLYMF